MTTSVPLILVDEPVPAMSVRPVRARQPWVAVVYATADGVVDVLGDGRPMTWSGQLFARYRRRYEIDMSDHHHVLKLASAPPPARGDAHRFDADLSVDFRVTDPAEIVRRQIRDGFRVVVDYLVDSCWTITRQFDIEDSPGAEAAVNTFFSEPRALPQGITVLRCQARLAPDEAARRYLTGRREAERAVEHASGQHRAEVYKMRGANQIAEIEQEGRLDREARERQALSGRPLDLQELLRIELERHPDRAPELVERMMQIEAGRREARERDADRSDEFWKLMLDRGLLRPAEIAEMRASLYAPPSTQVTVQSQVTGWEDPLPLGPSPAAAVPGPAIPEPAQNTGPVTSTPVSGIVMEPARLPGSAVPVYVVVDQSSAVADVIDDVNAGLRSLVAALASDPVVRLAVIGFAEVVGVRSSLDLVHPGLQLPALVPGGPPRYAGVFGELFEAVPRDVADLKAQTAAIMRPVVFFLTAAAPEDADAWPQARAQLLDRQRMPAAPHLIASGIGAAPPNVVTEIASSPEYAFVDSASDPGDAARVFLDYVAQQALACARALSEGQAHTQFPVPRGFRAAAGLV
jgi:uncharacterized protein YegL